MKDEAMQLLQSGVNLSNEDKFDEAVLKFDQVIELYRPMVQSLIQRGRCNWEMRRWELAHEDFKKAQAMDPNNADIPWTLSLMNLQMGNFQEGWKTFDMRWQSKKFDSPRLKTQQPQWKPHSGYKDLLVWSEQGVGDQILYCSLLESLKILVPTLTVMMDARLIPLFKRSFKDIEFIPQNAFVSEIDSQIPMGSIAKELVSDMEEIPLLRERAFLKASPERTESLRNGFNLKEGERLIGLSWASGAPRIGNHKSVPLEQLLPLLKVPNTRWVSLQYGDHYEEMFALAKEHGVMIEIAPEVDNTLDLDGLASLIDACDCVVTVSNVTGHLAGSLGKKTFLLDSNKLWYWGNCSGRTNLWYPSVRTYRKDNAIASWEPQIEELTRDFVKHFEGERDVFVFFRTGKNLSYTRKFVASLRKTNPDSEIIMCTDSQTPHVWGVSRRFEFELDTEDFMEYRIRIFAELGLEEPAMYLDDDMIVKDEIQPRLLLGDRDVLLCERSFDRDKTFNTQMKGIDFSEHEGKTVYEVYPYLACATVTKDCKFWKELLHIMDRIHPKYRKWYGDQECMRIYAKMFPFGTLPESEYACLPEYVFGRKPKIIHYKGHRKEQMK